MIPEVFGQQVRSRQVAWRQPVQEGGATAQKGGGGPLFEGAQLDPDRSDLPYLHESIPLRANVTGFTAYVRDAVYAPLTGQEVAQLPGLGTVTLGEAEVRSRLARHRKQPVAQVDIVPFRRNTGTGAYERLVSYRIDLVEEVGGGIAGAPRAGTYPANSRMASGEWYRFTVHQDGVYRVTYEFLQELGVSGPVASDQLNIYGNHEGMLPFTNSAMRPTDVLPNAIEVVDGGDGQFGPGDHLLFFASDAQRWQGGGSGCGPWSHVKNVYSDSASYFVGIGVDPPKRVQNAALSQDPATVQVTAFDDRQFQDRDLVNLIKTGRTWYAETFDNVTTYTYSFDMPYLRADDSVRVVFDGASRTVGTSNASTFSLSGSGLQATFSETGVPSNYNSIYARPFTRCFTFRPTNSTLTFTVSFDKFDPVTSLAWMNYLEVFGRRDLKMVGNQLLFQDPASVGAGQVAEYSLDLAQSVHRVWDVTDPLNVRNVAYSDGGAVKTWRMAADTLHHFVAFRNSGYLAPKAVGRVANQDLHATAVPTDMVIVCPDPFRSQAERLAERRISEGISVRIVSPQEVFNEFSSGQRDATAIKRYMKMLYDRAGADPLQMPRYLLLFGDGSYNNINLSVNNQNWIPSYQTAVSTDPTRSYTSDDYFALLDDAEGENTFDLTDIGVGRFPVSSLEQARQMVDKVLNYDRLSLLASSEGAQCSIGNDAGLSDWRNWVMFVSDDQEGDSFEGAVHMSQSDGLATTVEVEHPRFNINKVYLDAYTQYSTPGGERYPDAQNEVRERVEKGLLLVNYTGHGGEVGWAHERLLDVNTILGWSNLERLPLFMTATCEFTRWDDPARTSAGEFVFLNPEGGGIALMSTTRLAFSTQNYALAQYFYDHVFDELDEHGRTNCLGDIYRRTKVDITTAQGNQTNHRNFVLIGDPSMRLAQPEAKAVITAITDTLGNPVDTISALATVRITGQVVDDNDQVITGFNGQVVPTVFDKKVNVSTLTNDGGSPFNFQLRKNIIYRGRATVTNGQFSFTFVVPKDIQYQVGPGRVSVYAESASMNASGYTNDPLVGGTATNVIADEEGPRIELYLNDDRFVPGGITDETPLLFAKLFDDNGINTLGNSIGHDIVAVLDENTDQAVVLNDRYEADLDTYKSGKVRYRFSDLAEGPHTLSLKAWDVFNNSSTRTTEFVVAPSAELALEHVLNYPNPFTTRTEFYFEHNRPCSTIDVQVQVFTVSGRLVKTIDRTLTCDGFRSEPLAWDGLDDQGDKLARGVYVYRLAIRTEQGERADKFEKLVILR
ncbi:MAG: type IX secretion system sortase PorU [Flavobacteriales bacterium]|nr:type IX secretion system sortase PorU [Flavobacteriales bacterium]